MIRAGLLFLVGSANAFRPVVSSAPSSLVARHMSATSFSIGDAVAAKDVVIFSKSFCPFCAKTKTLFRELGVDADIYELDKRDDGADIQAELKTMTGQSTVPNVFVKGSHVGGNDDVQKANSNGELAKMLE